MTRLLQRSALALFNKKREPCSTEAIAAFASKAGISPDGWDRPLDEYTSIDDFFTRKYAHLDWGGPRERQIVSPSEGTAVGFASVGLMQQLWVKQKALTMQNIGIPSTFLPQFEACNVCYLKLDVNNLHRFYAPVRGKIVARVDYLENLRMSHSVRPFCLHAGWNILTENRRVLLLIDNDVFGVVLMMIVGGIAIDGIDMIVEEGDIVEQGQEVGCFHMGGSAILLAVGNRGHGQKMGCASGVQLREDLEVSSLLKNEFAVRVGDTLMQAVDEQGLKTD
jgi:phosphatidylserine decarboxylase